MPENDESQRNQKVRRRSQKQPEAAKKAGEREEREDAQKSARNGQNRPNMGQGVAKSKKRFPKVAKNGHQWFKKKPLSKNCQKSSQKQSKAANLIWSSGLKWPKMA